MEHQIIHITGDIVALRSADFTNTVANYILKLVGTEISSKMFLKSNAAASDASQIFDFNYLQQSFKDPVSINIANKGHNLQFVRTAFNNLIEQFKSNPSFRNIPFYPILLHNIKTNDFDTLILTAKTCSVDIDLNVTPKNKPYAGGDDEKTFISTDHQSYDLALSIMDMYINDVNDYMEFRRSSLRPGNLFLSCSDILNSKVNLATLSDNFQKKENVINNYDLSNLNIDATQLEKTLDLEFKIFLGKLVPQIAQAANVNKLNIVSGLNSYTIMQTLKPQFEKLYNRILYFFTSGEMLRGNNQAIIGLFLTRSKYDFKTNETSTTLGNYSSVAEGWKKLFNMNRGAQHPAIIFDLAAIFADLDYYFSANGFSSASRDSLYLQIKNETGRLFQNIFDSLKYNRPNIIKSGRVGFKDLFNTNKMFPFFVMSEPALLSLLHVVIGYFSVNAQAINELAAGRITLQTALQRYPRFGNYPSINERLDPANVTPSQRLMIRFINKLMLNKQLRAVIMLLNSDMYDIVSQSHAKSIGLQPTIIRKAIQLLNMLDIFEHFIIIDKNDNFYINFKADIHRTNWINFVPYKDIKEYSSFIKSIV